MRGQLSIRRGRLCAARYTLRRSCDSLIPGRASDSFTGVVNIDETAKCRSFRLVLMELFSVMNCSCGVSVNVVIICFVLQLLVLFCW